MAKTIFKYDRAGRPRASVVLQNGEHRISEFPIIDSGADHTSIPLAIGELLNLKKPEEKEIMYLKGVGGFCSFCFRDIMIEMCGYTFSLKITWMLDPIVDQVLLGRDVFGESGMFEVIFNHNIIFEKRKKK